MFRGLARRRGREADERMALAWHVEALARMKKLPKLKSLMGTKPEKRRRSGAELAAVAARWHAAISRPK